jgi:hypothetical protein
MPTQEQRTAKMLQVFSKIWDAAKDGQDGSATYAMDRLRLIQTYAEIGMKIR